MVLTVDPRTPVRVGLLALVGVLAVSSVMLCSVPERQAQFPPRGADAVPSCAVYYAPGAPDDRAVLLHLLADATGRSVRVCSSLEEWLTCDADLLVMRGANEPGRGREREVQAREAGGHRLKGRRVLGLGREARAMFSVLGLAIAQSCVLSVCPVDVMPMVELASGGGPESVEVYGMAHRISRQDLKMDCPFLPTWGPDARVVEVVARAASDPNYAVLARQMNYLYCAVAGTVQDWSTAFRGLVQRHVRGLCARPLAEFAWTEWPIGLEGVHEFSLAVNDHTSRAFLMTLFFKFSRRTMFSAELQQEGSTEVGMMLRPEGGWTSRGTRRVDASQGEGLRICLPLSSECDPNVGGGYWRLEVVNWDREREARCRLRISVEPSAVVEFPNGLRVSAGQPPKDAQTIRYLVRCVQGEDAGLWLDAEAALLAVGPQALPELRQALTLSKGDCRKRLRDVELKLLMEPD